MKAWIRDLFFLPVLITGLGLLLTGPVTAQPFTTLYKFTGGMIDGATPNGLILSGNTLYGTTRAFSEPPYGILPGGLAGLGGLGAVFKVNIDGTNFSSLYSFTETITNSSGTIIYGDGANPAAPLLLSSNTLYGTASGGGNSGNGTLFKVNTDGTGFYVLHTFSATSSPDNTNSDGATPLAGLVLLGSTLYGTTSGGGSSGNGTVFAVNTNGIRFTTLHSFTAGGTNSLGSYTNSDGAFPRAGLLLSGNTLYGTAVGGGRSGVGAVFSVNTDGSGFSTLYVFTGGSDGANPNGLILSGSTLYGTASGGGSSGKGTVFAVNTNGMGFTTLHSFTAFSFTLLGGPDGNSDGANPAAPLILSSNTLYGTASSGGSSGNGTMFAVNIDGTDFRTLYSFTAFYDVGVPGPSGNSDGASPSAGLILSSNVLYGTASSGGFSDWGTVFSFSLPIGIVPQFVYATDNDTITITGYHGSDGVVTIPSSIVGLPVTRIGNSAFFGSDMTSLTIPNSVTNIGTLAFEGCPNLTSVTIPNSVTTIGEGAFEDCPNLTSVTIGNSVTSIGGEAFEFCYSLTNIIIPNSVTSIGEGAFWDCVSLTNVTIGSGVTNLGTFTFLFCNNLEGVYFEGNAPIVPSVPDSGQNLFGLDPTTTVYYLPGTTGWNTTFPGPYAGGRPTAPWKPQLRIGVVPFGVLTNQFGFKINLAVGMTVLVEASTNLVNPVWSPLATNIINGGSSSFSDPRWTNYPARFYRIRSP